MITNLKAQTELSGFYIIYNGSVNIESEKERGMQHLMEHLQCKSFEHLMDEFETKGIDWNAYTSQNEIVFHFTGLDENLKVYRKELVEYLSNFSITKEQFENEKKIVLEEYFDSFNNQQASHYLNLDRKLFNNYNAIGELSALKKCTYLDCMNLFEKQFINPSKIINVSKNNDFNLDIDFNNNIVDKEYKYIENNDNFVYQEGNDFKSKSSIICLSPFIDDDFQTVQFINYILSSGLNSPLYKEIREKRQLVYSIGLSMRRMNNRSINTIATVTGDENVKELLDTLSMIFNNRDKYLTRERFEIVKESIKINLVKQEINRHVSVNRWINPDDYSITMEFLNNVNFDDCKNVFDKYFNFDDFYKSIDKEEFVQK